MALHKLREKLADYLEDAHAMEQSVLRSLDSMISTTEDPEIRSMLEHHKEQTERHERLLRERLDALGEGTSTPKEAQTLAATLLKGIADRARTDKPVKNATDGYVTEPMEIACYQILERLAQRADEPETAEVARRNRAEQEEQMARRIDASWERVLDLTLEEAGIRVGPESYGVPAFFAANPAKFSPYGGAPDQQPVITLKYASLPNSELPHRILLRGANLQQADLSGSNLAHIDLRGTYLAGARLEDADLEGANLEGADLSGANLADVDLSNAERLWERGTDQWKRGAGLTDADLSGANLSGADMSNAYLGGANLKDANVTDEQLALCKSLEGATMPDGSKHD